MTNTKGWQTKCAVIAAALLIQSCSPVQKQPHDATFASDAKQQDADLDAAKGGHADAGTMVMAQNDAAVSPDFSSAVGNAEMDKIRGGSNTLVVNSQNGIVSDNTLSGDFTTGNNTISNSFNGANWDGQVVQVSGNQNSVNVATIVNVTIENTPAAK